MLHDLTPAYLSFLVPPSVSETSRYNLRNADDFTTIQCRSQQYYTSFLPSVVRDWNNLPQHAKQINSLLSFKSFQARNKTKVPKHFYTGKRYWQVMHTRIRTNCSALNSDLYLKYYRFFPLLLWCCWKRSSFFLHLSEVPWAKSRYARHINIFAWNHS